MTQSREERIGPLGKAPKEKPPEDSPLPSEALAAAEASAGESPAVPSGKLLHGAIRRFHDEVGSPLAAIAMRLEILRSGKRLDPAADALVADLAESLGEVIESVRKSIKELRELEARSPRQT
ncbi:MAG: hypothetical protein IT169_06460 [Bryobacterales bacterium]|nr:hypothetical protein [Bryobacterales bacterium]